MIQENPNKTKQNCLHFLGFIRPNWDFSVGYAQKNKKICLPLNSRLGLCANVSGTRSRLASRASLPRSGGRKSYTTGFRFRKGFAQITDSRQWAAY
jgi:hypothetical protein